MNSFEQKLAGIATGIQRPSFPQPKKRANDIFQNAIGEYKFLKTQLKPEQSINLVCLIGGKTFDVFSVTASDHFVEIKSQDEYGDVHIITAPVEQVSFDIIVSKKTSDAPPREIGYKAIEEEHKKLSQKD
jgi:hypothetical protein